MQTIWKYELQVADLQRISIPKHHSKLTIQLQYGKPCLWAIVDPDDEKYDMELYTFGTGFHLTDDFCEYVGTYQDGPFVWHVFTKAS